MTLTAEHARPSNSTKGEVRNKEYGFTGLLCKLPSRKALPPHFVMKILLSAQSEFSRVSIKAVDRPSEKVHSSVNSFITSIVEISSIPIGRDFTTNLFASCNLRLFAAFITCFAQSMKTYNFSHIRVENCSSKGFYP